MDDECAPAFGQPDGGVYFIVFLSFTDFGIPVSIGGEYNMIAVELYMKMMGACLILNAAAL